MTAELWIPHKMPGLNELIAAAKGSGGRGLAYSRLKRQWGETIRNLAAEKGLPRFTKPVLLSFSWYEANKRRDPDNVAAGGRKLILDGLVAAGVLPGDGWRYVTGWADFFDISARHPGVGLHINDEPKEVKR